MKPLPTGKDLGRTSLTEFPGVEKPKAALSTTSTQSPSPPVGGVKLCGLLVAYVPICVATPVAGSYHHAVITLPTRPLPFTVTVREEGKYAIMLDPSDAYAAVA